MSEALSSLLPSHRITASQGSELRKELLARLKIYLGVKLWSSWGRTLSLLVHGIKTFQTMKSQIPSMRNKFKMHSLIVN